MMAKNPRILEYGDELNSIFHSCEGSCQLIIIVGEPGLVLSFLLVYHKVT